MPVPLCSRIDRPSYAERSSPQGEDRRAMWSTFLQMHGTPSRPNPPVEGEGVVNRFLPALLHRVIRLSPIASAPHALASRGIKLRQCPSSPFPFLRTQDNPCPEPFRCRRSVCKCSRLHPVFREAPRLPGCLLARVR